MPRPPPIIMLITFFNIFFAFVSRRAVASEFVGYYRIFSPKIQLFFVRITLFYEVRARNE